MTFSACRSSWICVSALALGQASAALSQDGTLRVRPADRDQYSTEPRQIVAATFTVSNSSSQSMEVESRISLPARWLVVSPPLPFVLTAGESALKLVSFTIPEDARAGDYPVSYEARDRLHPGNAATHDVRVRVIAAARVQVTVLDVPDSAVAGDTIAAGVIFRNAGNAPVSVEYAVNTRYIDSVSPRQGRLELEPAQSRRVDLAIVVARVREQAAARISVDARIAGSDLRFQSRGSIQIIPRASVWDALRMLDSRMETRYVARDSTTERTAGWQAAISGGGFLDEGGKDSLRFRFRGPDRRQGGTFGAPDEYWLRYDSPHVSAGAGDLNYGLSPLTEPGRLGRGAQLAVRRERWDFEAYGMRDGFGRVAARQFGAGSSWRMLQNAVVGVNYLNRGTPGDTADIWSLRAQAEPDPGLALDVELAGSEAGAARGGAARLALHDERFATHYYLLGWLAERGFEGPLRDKLYLSTGFDRPNPRGFGWRGYFRLQDWNLVPLDEIDPDDPRRGDAERMRAVPMQRRASLGATHALWSLANATLDLVVRERATRASSSWRAGLHRSWDDLSLTYALERGAAHDRASGERFSTSSQLVSGSLRVGRFQRYGFYWTRDEDSELDERDPQRESQGLTASYSWHSFDLKLDAQRSDSHFGRSAIYDLSLSREAQRGARFTLAARRIEGRFARSDYLLSYSVPFGMPVGRKHGYSPLRGRVLDGETAAGLRNVTLRLDGIAVATNARGEFEFPAVKAGTHRVMIGQEGLDMRQVPATLAPLDVIVRADAPPLSITLVRSVSINASVTLQAESGNRQPGAALLVSFRRGETELRRMTDEAGRARLAGVPPGRWIVNLAADAIPAGFAPTRRDVVLDLDPGASGSAEVELGPIRREMRMLAPVAVR